MSEDRPIALALSDDELRGVRDATASWIGDVCAALAADPPMMLRSVLTSVTSTGYQAREERRLDVVAVERRSRQISLRSFDPVAAFAVGRRDLFPRIPAADGESGTQRDWAAVCLAEPVLRSYLGRVGELRFDRAAFDDIFDRASADLRSPATRYTAVAGVDMLDLPDGPLEVLPGVLLRPRTNADLEQWINRPAVPGHLGYQGVDVVFERPYLETRGDQLGARQSHDVIAGLMTALQLHADCDAFADFIEFRLDGTFPTSMGGTLTAPDRRARRRGALRAGDVGLVAALHGRLTSSPNLAACEIALDRWNSLTAGGRPQGLIVDAWVGLESLLLRGDSATEIQYRATLRLASLIGRDAEERRSLRAAARRSYNGRSKVLHGADTAKLDLPGLAQQSRDYLRRALVTILALDAPFDPNAIEDQLLS